ncbi:MAG TPA: cupin domain-containing protein [Solirubrobacterales bacterium]|nr:cupin domain-containing protein [Solirubrobacterales bacterium]
MPNIYEPEFEKGERPEGFKSRRARVGYELSTELIGCSVWEIPPGQAAYPYHYHYSDEELVIVLEGEPGLRTPEGTRTLERGEAVRFPLGEEGAHQIFNASEEIVKLIAISSSGRPDVIVYPDGDKVGFGERLPQGGGMRLFFRCEDATSYFEGEEFSVDRD